MPRKADGIPVKAVMPGEEMPVVIPWAVIRERVAILASMVWRNWWKIFGI